MSSRLWSFDALGLWGVGGAVFAMREADKFIVFRNRLRTVSFARHTSRAVDISFSICMCFAGFIRQP